MPKYKIKVYKRDKLNNQYRRNGGDSTKLKEHKYRWQMNLRTKSHDINLQTIKKKVKYMSPYVCHYPMH